MGEIRINLTNAITIGLIAYVALWAANKGLDAAGLSRFKA